MQIQADAGELKNKKVQNLIARLGQEHKLSLFSKRPLLVEGPSDVIICSALANKLDIHLEAAGSQLLPVIGKGQMPTVAKLLRLLGKSPVALADADGIADGLELVNSYLNENTTAEMRANMLGFSSSSQMVSAIFADFCKLVDCRWNEISATAESHPYWVNKKNEEETQAKRRSAFCTLFIIDDNELSNLASDDAWSSIKTRLTVLLDLLEQCGLFILRKGSIESYYQSSDPFTSIGKPSAAVDEIDHINQLSHHDIYTGYSDLIRCIQHASSTEVICEADAMRDLLLSIVAPAHARLKSGELSLNFNTLAHSILGDRSKIFGLAIESEKLIISIESNILNFTGFPVTIGKDDDVLKCINAALAVNP